MSEVLIRNTISNINFMIEFNLDINLPREAQDSKKFLEELINSEKNQELNSNYFSDDKGQENLEETIDLNSNNLENLESEKKIKTKQTKNFSSNKTEEGK